MKTEFTKLSKIASATAERIRTGAAGKFKLVTHAQATTGGQVWEMLQAVASIPGAIVTIGSGNFGKNSLSRTVRLMVFVIAPFSRGPAANADGVWELTENVLDLFLPSPVDAGLDYPEICGIEFMPDSWAPIESEESVSAYCLTLEGTEFLTQE